jgi:hypothetical protein
MVVYWVVQKVVRKADTLADWRVVLKVVSRADRLVV